MNDDAGKRLTRRWSRYLRDLGKDVLETVSADPPIRRAGTWNASAWPDALPTNRKTVVDLKNALEQKTISPHAVRPDGMLTSPRRYGVYKLPVAAAGTLRYRYGNHPVRMTELEREFGSCQLCHLFLHRHDAAAMADLLNGKDR